MLAALACSTTRALAGDQLRFNRDVRPILSENCFRCHGPDKNQRKAKLRLDVSDVALERKAIVPGKPDESELIKHINATDPDEIMPPPDQHKILTAVQKETLKQWIVQGAEYEPHWAYLKPVRPSVPKPAQTKWVHNPIDAFILASLEAKKIRPSPEADKRTLLRRLSLDLTGLPPTLEELSAFLADKSSKAYEKQVDRLLASPHYGERMAVPWLDAVRFADTVGYHGDQNQRIFPYRDYVIDSYNKNKPFDQFTLEQLAGDLMPNSTDEQKVATGFNRLNMMTREGGAQAKEYMAKYAADRVRTVAGAWLGSTMGCCECHDHKYDPFATKDFYQMEAFFADLKQWGIYADYGYTPNPDLRGFSNEHPFPPEIEVPNPYLQKQLAAVQKKEDVVYAKAAAKLKSDATRKKSFDQWRKETLAFLKVNTNGWITPKPTVMKGKKDAATNVVTVEADGTLEFDGQKMEPSITLPLTNGWIAAIRVQALPKTKNKEKEMKREKAATISLSAELIHHGVTNSLSFFHAEADRKEDKFSNGRAVIGVKDLWQTSMKHEGEIQTAVWLLNRPVLAGTNDTLVIKLKESGVGQVRLALSPIADSDPLQAGGNAELQKKLARTKFQSHADKDLLERKYLLSTAWLTNEFGELRKLQTDALQYCNGKAYTMVAVATNPLTIRVLARGNWQDEKGEIVQPNVPHFLPQPPNPDSHRLTRLDLAKWLVSPENPLTARVIVNRMWKQFYGTGISAVVDDLGAQGEWPVHPELLDWLATEFEGSGWDVKHMVKLMVMSSVYRQQSNLRPELRDVDPNNRLLSCQSPRRLDAEFVRDNALSISGLINLDLGGPSVHPYQPAGYYVNIQFPERDYYSDTNDLQYRRGVYMHWQRTFLQPMLANFDAPGREESTCARNLSNTPQQALTLLNDPTFVESARAFAQELLLQTGKSDQEKLDYAFQKAVARPIKAKEQTSLQKFLAAQRQHSIEHHDEIARLLNVGLAKSDPKLDQAELAAWTEVCRVILNLHESITVY